MDALIPYADALLQEQMDLLKERHPEDPSQFDTSDDIRQQMVRDLAGRAYRYMLRKVLDSLDESELARLEAFTDADDEDGVQQILGRHQDAVVDALVQFRIQYLGTLI